MDLVIDAGNTRVKLGFFERNRLSSLHYLPGDHLSDFYRMLEGLNFDKCILGSVIDIPVHILAYLKGKSRFFLHFEKDTVLPIKVTYEKKTGSDRIALAVGASMIHPKAAILIIGTGTCITYNFVSAKGIYSGGGISPGLQMRFKSLAENTAALPLVEAEEKEITLVGKNTKESILSGVINGIVYEIEGFINAYRHKYPTLKCIICGGDSRYIGEKLESEIEIMPDLGLYGLHSILKFNADKKA